MTNGKTVETGIKLYLNGFPKAGTHALASLGATILPPVDPEHNWLGNFNNPVFAADCSRDEQMMGVLDKIKPGHFVKGHTGWSEELVEKFQENKFCKAFIFRDFRDVVVSTAFHAMQEKDTIFPKKEFYQALDFGEILKRVITGDETITGVMESWEAFAPWLDEDWVLKIAYDDLRMHPREVAGLFARYLFGKTANYYGLQIELSEENYNMFADKLESVLRKPEKSPTWRSGNNGDWKKYFTDEHKRLFKESDKNNWLVKLGYENDTNW